MREAQATTTNLKLKRMRNTELEYSQTFLFEVLFARLVSRGYLNPRQKNVADIFKAGKH